MATNWTPKKPIGESIIWRWRKWIWDMLAGGSFPIRGDGPIIVEWKDNFYRISSKPQRSGSSSPFPWQSPKELDPSIAVSINTFVYVSPINPLVTAGLIDVVSNTMTLARAGIWQAAQTIPAKTGAGKYNVPVYPIQSATAGSPLEGDLDAAGVYWIPWSPTPYC